MIPIVLMFISNVFASVLNKANIAIHRNINCRLLKCAVILSLMGLSLSTYFTIIEVINGNTMNVIILFAKLLNSSVFELEKNISR